MKKIITSLFILLLASTTLLADEIHLMDGRVVKGKVITVTSDSVEYDPEGKEPFDIMPRGQIFKIVYDSGKVVVLKEFTAPEKKKREPIQKQAQKPEDNLNDEDDNTNKFILGLTIGTPAGFNGLVGYHFQDFGIHISGFYFDSTWYGIEGNLIFFLGQTGSIRHGLSLLGGHTNIEITDDGEYLRATYAGPSYNFFWGWFYAQTGIGYTKIEEKEKNKITKETGIGLHYAVGAILRF